MDAGRIAILAGAILLFAAAVANLVWVIKRVAPPRSKADARQAPLRPEPEPAVEPQPEAPAIHPAPATVPEAEPKQEPPPVPETREPLYTPVAPVELRFFGERGRVGVRSGSATHEAFRRLADALLDDLSCATDEDER